MKKTNFKKALSVFLSVLMLVSCWVWVAPTEAEAVTNFAETINTGAIAGLSESSFGTGFTTVTGKFHGDTSGSSNYVTDANFKNQYKNILYSPAYSASDNALNSGWAANFTGISNIDSVRLWYPTTTMINDGSTNPKMGVLFAVDAASSKQVGVSNVYMSANANGLVMPEAYWHAKTTASKSPYYTAFGHLYLMYNFGASWISTSSGNDKTSTTSKGAWEVNASTIEYQGGSFGSGSTYYKAITPTWTVRSGSNYSVKAQNTIYVIDYVPLKNALNKCLEFYGEIKRNPGYYTIKSVAQFVNVANGLINAKPNNYINSSNNNVTGWNTAVSSALSAYNSFKLEKRTFELTYENIFSLSDLVNSYSIEIAGDGAGASGSSINYDINAGTITVTTGGGEAFTSCNSGSGQYLVPLEAGKEYTLDYDVEYKGGVQTFVFFYNDAGQQVTVPGSSNYFYNSYDGKAITFTVPEGATRVGFRFGTYGNSGNYANYSNIRLYETSRQDIVNHAKAQDINRVVYAAGESINTVPTITRTGYTFNDWLVKDVDNNHDGKWDSVYDYDAGAYAMGASFVIYSDWTEHKYNIAFNANGGSGSTAGINNVLYSAEQKLTSNSFTRTGYTFKGWNTKADGTGTPYADDATVSKLSAINGATVTLYAQWKINSFNVTFNYANGSSDTQTYDYGTTITAPSNSTKQPDADNHYTYAWSPVVNTTVTDDATYSEVLTTTAHTWGDWTVALKGDCFTDGIERRSCTVCGYTEEKNTGKDNSVHNDTADFAQTDATCTTDGYTAGTYCYNCGQWISGHEVIPAAHTPGDAATCTAPQTCTVCGAELAAKLTHTEVAIPAVPATCTTPGKTEGKQCSVCGTVTVAPQDTELAAHTQATREESRNEATCGADGSYVLVTYCSECKTVIKTETKIIPATGEHTWDDGVVTKAPTCITAGVRTYTCSVCNNTKTDAEAATGVHVYGDWSQYGDKHRRTCTADIACTAAEEEVHNFNGELRQMDGGNYHQYKCEKCEAYGVGTTMNIGEDCFGEGTSFVQIDGNASQHKEICKCGREKNDGHAYGSWAADPENKDNNQGKMSRICSECSYKQTSDCTYTVIDEKAATCTENGYKTYTCSNCGNGYTEIIKATGVHEYKTYVSNDDATCQKNATETASCAYGCGNTDTREIADSTVAHKFETYTANNDATCQKNATETASCAYGCGETDTKEIADSKVAHKFETYTANNDATCQKNATETASCAYGCGATDTKEVADSKADHKYETYTSNNDATCQKNATETANCVYGCGATDTKEVADSTVAHKFETYTANNDATCQKNATETANCVYGCGATDTKEVADSTVAHKFETYTSNNDATCQKNATETAECEFGCGTKDTRDIENSTVGHKYTKYTSDNNAECEKDGTKTAFCDYECGTKDTIADEGSALKHTEATKEENRVEASCGADGSYDLVTYCSVCGKVIKTESKTINATGKHNYVTEVEGSRIPATCTTEGEVTFKCGCGATQVQTLPIDANNHKKLVTDVAVDATCYSTGLTAGEHCEACDVVTIKQTATEKIAHTPAAAVIEKLVDSTCYSEGSYDEVVYCSVEACKYEISRTPKTIEKKEHTAGEAVIEKLVDSTCYSEGSYDEVVYCSVEACKHEISRTPKTIEKKEHTAGEAVVEKLVDSTCYSEGSYDEVVYCSVCAAAGKTEEISRTSKTIEKKDHTPAEAVRENEKAATCTAEGSYDEVVYCSVCKEADKVEELSRVEKTLPIDANAHTGEANVVKNKSDATCTADGYTGDIHWSCCKALKTKGTAITMIPHKDENKDHACDYGCDVYQGEHKDSADDRDHLCDYGCNVVIEACTDGDDNDHNCDICGKEDVSEHSYGNASCNAPATCTVCGATTGGVLGHSFKNYVSNNDATCTEDGTKTAKCERCDATETIKDEGSALSHDWSEVTYNFAEDGSACTATRTCNRTACKETETATAKITSVVKTAATCKVKGTTTYTATFTENWAEVQTLDVQDIAIDENNHENLVTDEAVDATCYSTGLTAGEHCEACDVVTIKQTATEKIAHTPAEAVREKVVDSSCYAEGSYDEVVYCSVEACKYEISRTPKTIEKKEHTPAEAVKENEKASTCNVAGSYDSVVYCSVCNDKLSSETIDLPLIAHTEVVDAAVAATCTATGLTEGKHCSVCGEVIVAQTVVGALGHAEVAHEGKAATCTEAGWKAYVTCSRCDYTTYEAIPQLLHKDDDNDGYCDYECGTEMDETCKHVGTPKQYITNIIDNTHSIKCLTCGVVFETTECTYDTEIFAATCCEEGYTVYTCVTCGYSFISDYVAADPELHSFNIWYDNDATCKEYKTKVSHCDNPGCFETKTVTVLENGKPVFGAHSLVVVPGKNPTCTKDGYTSYSRCVVCETVTESEKLPAFGHKDANGDGNCDVCAHLEAPNGKCTCFCHNDAFFVKLFYKFVNFFWKLFKINANCECGTIHW